MAVKTLAAGKAVSIMLEIVHMTVNGEEKELAVDPREPSRYAEKPAESDFCQERLRGR